MQNGVEGAERLRPLVHGAEVVAAVRVLRRRS